MIRSIEELMEKAIGLPSRSIVIAAADNESSLEAAVLAEQKGLASSILVGSKSKITNLLENRGVDPSGFTIHDESKEEDIVKTSVKLVADKEGSVLLKGGIKTGTLLKGVLDKEAGLRGDRLLSDVFIFDCPLEDEERIMGITDGGINLEPGLDEKTQITKNAIEAFHLLGYDKPEVAVLSVIEEVNPDIRSSVEASKIKEKWENEEFPASVVEGPIAMDLALSEKAGKMKDYDSPVLGTADIFVFPDIESANITAKALMYSVPFEPAHIIMGAKAPVLISSRSDTPKAKLNAVAFGCLAAERMER